MNVWVENKRAKTTFYTLKNSEKPVQNAVEELKKSIRLLTGAEVPSKEITQIDEAKNGVVFATFSASISASTFSAIFLGLRQKWKTML